jgi:CRP-like cAMP-binding protein
MKEINCILCQDKSAATCKLNQDDLKVLGNNCVVVNYKKGDNIFLQGTLSSSIIYMKKGLAKIHMHGPSKEKILRLTKGPAYLGIPTTFGDKINRYSATALEDTTVCFIETEAFKNFIFSNGDFAYEIILDLCMNELADNQRYVDLFQKQIPGRLATTLLCMANKIFMKDQFELPLSRSDLGDLVGTSRESICRLLNDFHDQKIIEIKKKQISILKENLLEEISEKG